MKVEGLVWKEYGSWMYGYRRHREGGWMKYVSMMEGGWMEWRGDGIKGGWKVDDWWMIGMEGVWKV